MRTPFVKSVLDRLVSTELLDRSHRVLAICAGQAEREVFLSAGFDAVTISNLDERKSAEEFAPYESSIQDAMNLSYPDDSFDFAFVSDGLHHCSSPHRALLEMYRVAGKGVIVIESRDSLLVRTSVRLGLATEYEVEAAEYHEGKFGGVDNCGIPNFVYRWTEREFEKTIYSRNPTGQHKFLYMYGFNIPESGANANPIRRSLKVLKPFLSKTVPLVAPKQCNTFAMIALRPSVPDDLWPWIRIENGVPRLKFPNSQA